MVSAEPIWARLEILAVVLVSAIVIGYSGLTTFRKAECDAKSRSKLIRGFCKKNRIQTHTPRSLRGLAQSSRFKAVRKKLGSAYALRDHLEGRVLNYPKKLAGYKWLFRLLSRATLHRYKDQPTHLNGDAPACPIEYDFGPIVVCVLHPGADELVAVQIGSSEKTWFLVSAEHYRERAGVVRADP